MKIKFVKDSKACKKGEIIECKDDEAKVIIEEGYAVEYVDEVEIPKQLQNPDFRFVLLGKCYEDRNHQVYLLIEVKVSIFLFQVLLLIMQLVLTPVPLP